MAGDALGKVDPLGKMGKNILPGFPKSSAKAQSTAGVTS